MSTFRNKALVSARKQFVRQISANTNTNPLPPQSAAGDGGKQNPSLCALMFKCLNTLTSANVCWDKNLEVEEEEEEEDHVMSCVFVSLFGFKLAAAE